MQIPLFSHPNVAIALCAFAVAAPDSSAVDHEICACKHDDVADEASPGIRKSFSKQNLALPQDFPESFSTRVQLEGRSYTLSLSRNSVFGKNTRFLVSGAGGSITEVDPGPVRTYLGEVDGMGGTSVSALLTDDGVIATISRPGMSDVTIEPDGTSHRVLSENPVSKEVPVPKLRGSTASRPAGTAKSSSSSTATLPPTLVMDVLEYEIGVEIGSRAFNSSTYNSDMTVAMASAQSTANNLDRRYLSGAGIKHVVGTVIIRKDNATDPLRASVTATGAATNASPSLAAFRDYWNANPGEVGDTHDLAVYHVRSAPSGLAYVNSVGGRSRYATSGGNGATSWADGTLVHEFGHSWNLRHNNTPPTVEYDYGSGAEPPPRFYEAKPRTGAGSLNGSHTYVSVMNGSGRRNIGRFSTDEANIVYSARQQRRQFGTVIDPSPQKPFGRMDVATSSGGPITIDVIANDFDVNNDVLDVELRDTTSDKGGTITLSQGTGPGGRNELIYSPPTGRNGTDFFHYDVCDSTGRKDWGAVYVTTDGPVVVDTSLEEYRYDLGPDGAPVLNGWNAITPDVTGDISWSGGAVTGTDRGSQNGINAINQDFISSTGARTLSHKVSNGIWAVTLNIGESNNAIDQMRVSAENGQIVKSGENSAAGEFAYISFDVDVSDGQLDLEFSDEGGSSSNWAVTRYSLRLLESTVDDDDDGLLDNWEIEFFGNLTSTAGLPGQDADGDGLSDRQESIERTDPTKSDTDSDGLDDLAEINEFGTDPSAADTDGDGVPDGVEVAYRSDPKSAARKPDFGGLVALYPFDEGSGTTAKNIAMLSGESDAEQNQGSVSWTTTNQRIGAGSLDLNGSSSLLAASPMPDDATAMTISLWVNPDSSGNFKGIFVGRDSPGNWGINIQDGYADIRFAKPDGGSEGVDTDPDSIVPDGGWYHIALTWVSDGSSTTGLVYLNGALVKTTTKARPDFVQPTEGFYIGDDPCCGSREFDGQIDDLAVFSRALSGSEIMGVYTGGQQGIGILETLPPPPFVAPEPFGVTLDPSNGEVSFQFETEPEIGYRILGSPDLNDWSLLDTIFGDGNLFKFDHDSAGPRHFYRIE